MVTIPTIDQISGTTVMNKMRSLIHAFINFATGVDDEITEFESTVTQDFYTKLEIDTKFADYYTKSQIDNGWYTKFEIQNEILVNYYTKTEVNGLLDGFYNKTQIDTLIASYYTKTETDTLLSAKQDVLTAGDNITIENNVISASGGSGTITYFDTYSSFVTLGLVDSNFITIKDFVIEFCICYYGNYYYKSFTYRKGVKLIASQGSAIDLSYQFFINSRLYVASIFLYPNSTTKAGAVYLYSLSNSSTHYALAINETALTLNYDYSTDFTTFTSNRIKFRIGVI